MLTRRVLNVRGENPQLLDTALSDGPHHGHYAALSHCWGHSPPLITKSNFLDRLAGISFKSMPRTFQNAVTVAQRLGCSYNWIDSLCIVQDSPEDWMSESKKMGTIYQHARVTIAATGANNGTGGCFTHRPKSLDPILLPLTAHKESNVPAVYTYLYSNEDEGNIKQSPLNERG